MKQSSTAPRTAARAGFLAAAREAGVPVLREAIGATSYETGLELGTALLARRERPDGIFCATDLLACGLMDAARHRFGLRVPLSVIGFDDIAQAGWDAHALTTFAQPCEEIAAAVVDRLAAPEPQAGLVRLSARRVWCGSVRLAPRRRAAGALCESAIMDTGQRIEHRGRLPEERQPASSCSTGAAAGRQ